MIRNFLFLLFLVALCACTTQNRNQTADTQAAKPDSSYLPSYAKGFRIDYFKGQRLITLNDPFDSLRPPQTICVLSKIGQQPLVTADQTICSQSPRWVTLSSTHISTANLLNLKEYIVGVAEPHYIRDTTIQARLKRGEIRNVGMAMSPDLEVVIAVKPTFVMVSPFPDISYSSVKNTGIAVVPNASYLENTPLARAEWMVFVAALFGKENEAIKIFRGIEQRYRQTQAANAKIEVKPTLFTGNFYQGVWYASKGQNYMAKYFADAGADYIYKSVEGTGTLSLEFEKIFVDANEAEYWVLILNHPGEVTYDVIKHIDARYAEFGAYKSHKIIYTNANTSLFFEQAEQCPDVVLNDFTFALHPELMPDYQPRYFRLLR